MIKFLVYPESKIPLIKIKVKFQIQNFIIIILIINAVDNSLWFRFYKGIHFTLKILLSKSHFAFKNFLIVIYI